MKTKSNIFITAATIAFTLAATGSIHAAAKKTTAVNVPQRPNLCEAARGNHNALLPASFYDSNHQAGD